MVEINIYQSNDIVEKYISSWNIDDEKTILNFQKYFEGQNVNVVSIISYLDKFILDEVKDFIKPLNINKDSALYLVKLIYLNENLFSKFNIFNLQSKKESFIKELLKHKDYYSLPVQHKIEMPTQTIKIFNPFAFVITFLKGMKKYVRK